VDTPELNRAGSREAGTRALLYVREVMPIGKAVILFDTRPDPDSFGRWLTRVMLAPGVDLASLLLKAGHAVPMEG
jgi:endonuclease YncB( thermonuclease family)